LKVDEGGEDSHLRFPHDNRHIKYVLVAAGVYTADEMCFESTITSLLGPLLPPGVWNYGYMTKHSETGLPHFAEVAQNQLRRVSSVWHPVTVDHLDLVLGESLKLDVYDATCSLFDTPVVASLLTGSGRSTPWVMSVPPINGLKATISGQSSRVVSPKKEG
jgi:hypothetical protein